MRQRDHRFEDPDVFENGILKDGKVAVVKMRMRDGLPDKPLTTDQVIARMVERRKDNLVTDGTNNLFGLNHPGFRYAADPAVHNAARQKVADAHAEYVHDLENAWRTSPVANIGALDHASPVEGGSCTTSGGAPGTYQLDEDSGELTCVADPRVNGATDGRSLSQLVKDRAAVMEPIYESYAREISQAWKTK